MPNRSFEIAVRYLYNGFSISRGSLSPMTSRQRYSSINHDSNEGRNPSHILKEINSETALIGGLMTLIGQGRTLPRIPNVTHGGRPRRATYPSLLGLCRARNLRRHAGSRKRLRNERIAICTSNSDASSLRARKTPFAAALAGWSVFATRRTTRRPRCRAAASRSAGVAASSSRCTALSKSTA